MRIGDLTKVQADDLTLMVNWTWGQMKALAKKLQALDEKNTEAFDRLMAEEILPHVVKVEGLLDAEGVPIEKLTAAILDELPPHIILALLKGLQGGGPDSPPA